ncbi:hypothetical protein CDV36_014911 [Fusarium kuroshium]|uniref:Uncharacterized protein n=1 Tax=Fusarium kuroshium TaxID=2010991 RepID=A0A3M2REJ3_9HYPO|nr:hypothetical protein CDV36_014911 [Fusarium kuroshium]
MQDTRLGRELQLDPLAFNQQVLHRLTLRAAWLYRPPDPHGRNVDQLVHHRSLVRVMSIFQTRNQALTKKLASLSIAVFNIMSRKTE